MAKSKMDINCCKNEVKYIKIKDNFSTSFHANIDSPFSIIIDNLTSRIYISPPSPLRVYYRDHAPPPKQADRAIFFRSILI